MGRPKDERRGIKRAKQRANATLKKWHRRHLGPIAPRTNLAQIAVAILEHHGVAVTEARAMPVLRSQALEMIGRRALPVDTGHVPTTAQKAEFYASWEWATARMKALKANGGRCECCGATSKDHTVSGERVRLQVDHIKPLSKHWDMRLDPENVQVLCAECNKGKGAWDETDWRESAA